MYRETWVRSGHGRGIGRRSGYFKEVPPVLSCTPPAPTVHGFDFFVTAEELYTKCNDRAASGLMASLGSCVASQANALSGMGRIRFDTY